MSTGLDRVAVEVLTVGLCTAIKNHYDRRPPTRETALEALNAIAIAVAMIIGGARDAGDEDLARHFLENAIDMQLSKLPPKHPPPN